VSSYLHIVENGSYLEITARVSTTVLGVVYTVLTVILLIRWWRKR
jgi:hypothetical protein